MRIPRGLAGVVTAVLAIAAATSHDRAEDATGKAPTPSRARDVLTQRGFTLSAETLRSAGPGEFEASGAVTIEAGDTRIQADRMTLHDNRFVEAEGNVLIVWLRNRISGTHIRYDIEQGVGVIENAIGQVEPDFYFDSETAEKIGDEEVLLHDATVTTCTQPVPYWSFSVTKARVRLDEYAHLWNLRLRAGKVPIFYLPYLVWPVKRDRALGLLLPEFGTTEARGRYIMVPLFIPLGQSADLRLFGSYYRKAGWGGGGEFNLIPNRDGSAKLRGFYIQDQVSGFPRWQYSYQQTQRFMNGFRMVADINQISDAAYYSDYERDLILVSTPSVLARLEFGRNGSWTSLNVRELRREQLFSDGTSLVQKTLPQIEFRGRSRRLGTTPFYLAYESSIASITQSSSRIDADYMRADLFPTLSAPFSPTPWLDINPSVNFRSTYYTQRQEPLTVGSPVEVVDEPLFRNVLGAGLDVVGPKFFRIFERTGADGASKYKHTIEPRLQYIYQRQYDRSNEVIVYDAVDGFIGRIHQAAWGLRTRLFARRPRAKLEPAPDSGERVLVAEGEEKVREVEPPTSPAETAPGGAAAPPPAEEPLEIASFELRQSRSLERDVSFADTSGDGIVDKTSRFSDVSATGRYSPEPGLSVDLRANYHVLYRRLYDLSLSGNWRGSVGRASFSLVRRDGLILGPTPAPVSPPSDSTQMVFYGGVNLLGGKVRLDANGTWVPTAPAGQAKFPDQRVRTELYTQCCGFLVEYLRRDFVTTQRDEWRIAVDLRGIGKLFDYSGGNQP